MAEGEAAAAAAGAGGDGQAAGGSPLGAGAGGAGGGGQQLPEWYGGLSEANRTALAAKAYESPDALAAAFVEAEKKIGAKGIIVPGKDAKPEDWDPVWNALGRPEAPDKYDLNGFERPEGWNTEAEKGFLAAAHKAGLPNGMARFALEHYRDLAVSQIELNRAEQQAQLKDWETGLKGEWGGEYDAKLDKAKLAVRAVAEATLGDKAGEVAQYLDDSGLGWHPGLTKMFAALHDHLQLGEDGKLVGTHQSGGPATASGAKAELEALEKAARSDPKHPLWDRDHPEHKATVATRAALYAKAFPGTVPGSAGAAVEAT